MNGRLGTYGTLAAAEKAIRHCRAAFGSNRSLGRIDHAYVYNTELEPRRIVLDLRWADHGYSDHETRTEPEQP